MDDLRQVQCVVADCGRVFFLCRRCDRGHVYCVDGRHDAERATRRQEQKRAHWRKHSAKRKTSVRTRRWRKRQRKMERQRKIETDIGSAEVGQVAIVSGAERSTVTVTVESSREETTNGIDLDGDRPKPGDDASDRHDGAERHDIEGAAGDRAEAPSCPGNAARSSGTVAGTTSPRCALCGRRGSFVRLQPVSRSVLGRAWGPGGEHRRRRTRLPGLGNFRDLERLVVEEVAR